MFFCHLFLSRGHTVDLRKYAIICSYSVDPDCLALDTFLLLIPKSLTNTTVLGAGTGNL